VFPQGYRAGIIALQTSNRWWVDADEEKAMNESSKSEAQA